MTATASTDLIIQEVAKLDPVALFKDGTDTVITQIQQHARSFLVDATTEDGREFAKSLAYKVSRAKTLIDEKGKGLVDGIKKQAGEIDRERKKVRDTLDELRDEIKKPVEDWEQADLDRKDKIETALRELLALAELPFDAPLEEIERRFAEVSKVPTIEWDEYADRYADVVLAAVNKLTAARGAAVKRAAEQAELEVLRTEQRKRIAEENDERAAKAEQAKKEQAKKDAEENEAHRVFAEQYNEAWSLNRSIDAAAAAVEAERKRVADQAAADLAAETKREANKRHRAKIHNEALQAIMVAFKAASERNDHDLAKAVVEALVRGDIPHVKLSY